MKTQIKWLTILSVILLVGYSTFVFSQSKALKSITETDLRTYLEFIAADEFHGRDTPSDLV